MQTTSYRALDATRLVDTARRLEARIRERFPESGLLRVSAELTAVVDEARARCAAIRRNYWPLRASITVTLALLAAGFIAVLWRLRTDERVLEVGSFFQALDAALGSFVFLGALVFFLWSLETRFKRQKALAATNELRALAHIVDMHQLTKDPELLTVDGPRTESSPERLMSPFELSRYLDYSSELLSIIAKVGALYAHALPDQVALDAVDAVETLCTGLSGKIWQKIMILDRIVGAGRASS